MSENVRAEHKHWHVETDADGLTWIRFDKAKSKVNTLSSDVLLEFEKIVSRLEANPPCGAIIHSGKTSGFVLGADINEFTTIESAEQGYELIRLGQQLFDRIESLCCPTVAVLNGHTLGGGFELALACTYRIALDNSKPIIGLPEVQLGLHPGFGGTVRSVRMAGVRAAMPLMLTGKPIQVNKAHAQGLIDRIVTTGSWRQVAREVVASDEPKQTAPLLDKFLNFAICRPFVGRMLTKQVAGRARKEHYPAPYAMIDLWTQYGGGDDSYAAEARSFAELMVGNTSRNLVRVFFLQNRLKEQGKKRASGIEKVHVIGAGTMGGDIAAWCALRGLRVTLQDREQKYVAPAMQRATKLFNKRIRNTSLRAEASDRLAPDIAGDGARQADLIIEAIFENTEAKHAVYRDLRERMKHESILASNTSSIRIEELRTACKQPGRFVGLHFFNPVAKLPLVEVIRCDDTEEEALDRVFAFVKSIGKLPLECRSSPGFVVNRILAPYMAEAMHLVAEGVPIPTIDATAEEFGMPMGPIELIDSVGLDVAMHVSNILGTQFDREVPDILSNMVDAGNLGRKSGKGFYRWVNGKADKEGAGKSNIGLTDRLILPMVNESVAVLSEQVVRDADLLDAGVIFGTGFAPFHGGPLQYARSRGIDDVVASLSALAATYADSDGDRFLPHPGFDDLRGRSI